MTVLPSSPVWYQSRGIDSSHNGILAFASRNLIYTLDLNDRSPVVHGILSGHSDKVTSCSFCPPITQDQLLRLSSGAEDCTVKVWDVKQKLFLQEHSAHVGNKIVSVHWSPVNPSLILSGDEKGYVVCWNLDNNKTHRYDPDGSSQLNLCCLTCSPHDENIVAVGYKSGAVSLVDINKNGNVIRKLRAHTNEVHGIVWMPLRNESLLQRSATNTDEGRVTDDYKGIIVTGSKDKTIKLWSISNGKCGKSLKVPTRVTKGKKVKEDTARLYTTVYWPSGSQTKFISSGYNGDLIVWDLHPDAENLFTILTSQGRETGHQRIVFNICHGTNPKTSIVSTSMDRQILHFTIPDLVPAQCKSPDWVLPTLGGFVYSLAVSLQDPSTLALGVGDGMIRIWKTRSPKSSYDIDVLWEGIKEKVMSLSWHPLQEGYLAFATEDGKVGVYDVRSMRPPVLASTYHLKPVYALSWGPECVAKSSVVAKLDNSKHLNIYSCGADGIIYQHFFEDIDADAINIDTIIESSNPGGSAILRKHSEVSWSNDGRLLGIGNDNGVIQIFSSPNLQHIITIKCHPKIVNCIVWKPSNNTVNDYEISTGSNNSTIFIHDLKKIFLDQNYTLGNEIDVPINVTKPSKTLIGHLSRITGLSYNSRNPVEIVSSCYDGTAQVWNTVTERPLYNFRGHHGRLMCAVWTSVIHSDSQKSSGIIYTGADDYTVHGWYAEDQEHTEPVKVLPDLGFGPKNKFQSKKKAKQKKKSSASPRSAPNATEMRTNYTSSPCNGDLNDTDHDLELLLEKRRAELVAKQDKDRTTQDQSFSEPLAPCSTPHSLTPVLVKSTIVTTTPSCVAEASQVVNDEEMNRRTRKKLKNLFPRAVALDNRKKSDQHKDCLKIVQWKMAQDLQTANLPFVPGDQENLNLGFYTDRRAAFRMMKLESDKLQEDNFVEGSTNIKLLMGDVVGALNEAAEQGQLTDQLVAMAPMAGQNFWRGIAYKYAKQLIEEGHQMHAVQYLLVSDKLEEAVDALLAGKHYREAVALVRARFCDNDPLLKKTVKMWAQKLKFGGSVELAAKCFASIGEFAEAADVLSQRATCGISTVPDSDIASLWAAASICKCAQKSDLASIYANRALSTVCCRTWDWEKNQHILLSYPNLQEYSFISLLHETIVSRLLLKSLVKDVSSMKKSYTWVNSIPQKDSSFVDLFLLAWTDSSTKSDQAVLSEQIYHDVKKECITKGSDLFSENKFLVQLSVEVAAAVCSCYGNKKTDESCVNRQLRLEESFHTDAYWVTHVMNSLGLVQKSCCDDLMKNELVDVICSVVNWCAKTVTAEPDGKLAESEAINFLLGKAPGHFDHLQSYLTSKLPSSYP